MDGCSEPSDPLRFWFLPLSHCFCLFLQAIRYLAECRANQEKLRGELGMMLSLQNVVHK